MKLITSGELDSAAEAVEAGELVIVPTRRWYMVCANANDADACQRIFTGKKRPTSKPLALVVPSARIAHELFVLSPRAQTLISALWPGDLAIITPWRDPAVGQRHAAVGTPHALITHDPGILGELATKSQVPIATTTASISSDPQAGLGPAITVEEVDDFLQVSGMKVAFCIDGGICPAADHLTVVDCTDKETRVIRTGLVHERAIAAALHEGLR